MKKLLCLVLVSFCAFQLSSCTPIGAAAGAGAALGVSAASERGVSGTASDLKIKALISDKWFKYDLETFAKLNLTVNDGRVLITGVVQNPDARVEAVKLAWQVEGVTQVINEIRVADGDGVPGYVRDQWITTRLRTAITFNREIYSINYSIDTVKGVVYLMGIAQSQAELNKVIEIARTIPHVQQVVSYVSIAPGEPGSQAPRDYTGGSPSASSYSEPGPVMTAPAPAAQGGVNEWGEPIGGAVAAPPPAVESEPIRW